MRTMTHLRLSMHLLKRHCFWRLPTRLFHSRHSVLFSSATSHSLLALQKHLDSLAHLAELHKLEEKYRKLDQLVHSDGFFKMDNKAAVMMEHSKLHSQVDFFSSTRTELTNLSDLLEMALEEGDSETLADIAQQVEHFEQLLEEKEFETLMSGEMDGKDAFVEIHAGAGGTESCDWVLMLKNMYTNWAESMDFRVTTENESKGPVAGLKSCTLRISGEYSFGWMRTESGVHRLVRISPFDSNARRHTSFAEVFSFPHVDDDTSIHLNPADLEIETMRASGAGGQHVNKTDSAVRITHIPTGISVRNQSERDQHQNKQTALKLLTAKLYQYEEKKRKEERESQGRDRPDASFGHQIRSYVLHPYKVIKDTRTNYQSKNPDEVFEGPALTMFMKEALRKGL